MDRLEQDFQQWWDALPANVRDRILADEASIGARFSWNQRYVEARKIMGQKG